MPEMLAEHTGPPRDRHVDLPPPGKFGFVGREDENAALEAAFRDAATVLITGPAGVGKTELACEYARRAAERGDRSGGGGVLYTSFDYGEYDAGLPRVLHEIGTTLKGIDFARLSLEDQRRWTIDYLVENPCLLVWDNFENVAQYLDESEVRELVGFLREVGVGPNRVLITGRSAEWANGSGVVYRTHELGGLNDADAGKLGGLILDDAGASKGSVGAGYPELLRLVGGNPMCMRTVLPHLKAHASHELVEGLGSLIEHRRDDEDAAEIALGYSFSLLSPRTRAHLPSLALFEQRVLLDVLTFMTQGEAYVSVMGEAMGWGACRTFLREAREFSILDSISPSVYLLSTPVSLFLRRQLRLRLSDGEADTLDQEFVKLYAGLADYFLENLSSEASDSTVTGVLAEEANLLRALGLAEARGQWENVQLILQPLGQVYRMQARVIELRHLRERTLARIGHEAEVAQQRGAIDLWMYLQGTEAGDSIDRQELDRAEKICNDVLEFLEVSGDTSDEPRKASTYHQLGLIAQGNGRYEEAEERYRAALSINEALGETLDNEAECADCYHGLGLVSQALRRFEEAAQWHQRALAIRERLEDEPEVADECRQLALVSEARHETEGAIEWYHRARAAYEGAGDNHGVAAVYHRLGLIDQARYQYEEAIGWYQRALLVYEELQDELGGADDCFQLGTISLQRYDYDDAEEWLRRALEAYQSLGMDSAVAGTYHRLGVAAHAQGRSGEAEGWYEKTLEIFVRREDEVESASTWGQLGLLAEQRGELRAAVWYVAHVYEIATAHRLTVLAHAKAHLASLRNKMGTEAFIECWKQISDTDVLPELEQLEQGKAE